MSSTRSDVFQSLPSYTVSYDLDGGEVFAIDLAGHGHDLDVVELFLHTEGTSVVYDESDDATPRCWEVSEVWRRSIPMHDEEHEGSSAYHYQGYAQRGATPVTHIEYADPPRRWCINHIDRPGGVGVPASSVIDGEATVARELARAAKEIDPRVTVEAPTDRRQRPYLNPGYIYLCRECSNAFFERERAARAAAEDEYDRERAVLAGEP